MKTITVAEWNKIAPIGKSGKRLIITDKKPTDTIRRLGTLKKYFNTK